MHNMATRRPAASSLVLTVVALLLLLSTCCAAGGGASSIVDEACATTAYPELCKTTLLGCPDGKDAGTPRALAEVAIRAASDAGAAAGSYARDQMALVRDDNALWTCLDECADDIEEAVSHLDDTEGEVDDDDAARFQDVKLFLDTAERDSWSCDDACKYAPPSPVKAALLAKNKQFETIMNVTSTLVKQATRGAGTAAPPAPAPTTTMPSPPP